jgi:predicted phosphodiesterase
MKNVLILMDDVHLEGRPDEMQLEFAKKVKEKIITIKNDGNNPIVICAGDIGEGISGVQWASQFQCEIIYICGNHEFWNGDFYEVPKAIVNFCSKPENKHIHFLNKESIILNGTRFIGATLWTSLGDYLPWLNKNYVIRFFGAMGDFKRSTAMAWYTESNINKLKNFLSYNGLDEDRIKDTIENKNFNPLIEIEENKKSVQFFIKELSQKFEGQTIVISHHLPVYQLWMKKMKMLEDSIQGEVTNNEKFFLDCAKGNILPSKDILMMSFYVNDLKDLMYGESAPDFWLHGHLHTEMQEIIGRSKIISSPVGYLRQSKEMKIKEIYLGDNLKYVKDFVKKEIEDYSWNDKLYETIRSFEKIIVKFELCVSMGIMTSDDFSIILKDFQKSHESNLKELKIKTNEWLKYILYATNPQITEKEIDSFLVKKVLGFKDSQYKFPEVLAASVNENSFLSFEKFKLANAGNLNLYHYKDWLTELQKIQIQLSQYKKGLLEFTENFQKPAIS